MVDDLAGCTEALPLTAREALAETEMGQLEEEGFCVVE